jgi:hypothetical protein
MLSKNLKQNYQFLGIFGQIRVFFLNNFVKVQFVTKVRLFFLNLRDKTDFLHPTWPILREKLPRLSAVRKNSISLQLAEKHFTSLFIFKILLFESKIISGLSF